MVSTTEMHRSSRSPDDLARRLEAWLARRVPGARIASLNATAANGMSSETVLVDVDHDGGAERLAVRLAPDAGDCPVFPVYDLAAQFETIRLVAELTDVPVPNVRWLEPDPGAVGTPFFVMDRVDGEVPPDVMPYSFGDSWVFAATPDEQERLQRSTLEVLASLHGIDGAAERFAFLERSEPGDSHLRRHVAHTRAWYEFATVDLAARSPLVEQLFARLERTWPATESSATLSWGDARIGNVMYRDFAPVAVLDWEMAGIGPRELDVAWLLYAHRIFDDLAHAYGFPGMPQLFRVDDVAREYESLTGHAVRDLEWFGTYAALNYGIVFLRTGCRAVRFGERDLPADIDDLIINREPLERMLDGTYWS
jgi:aminoglycoside phosphotransferase (APT) family kinase protein